MPTQTFFTCQQKRSKPPALDVRTNWRHTAFSVAALPILDDRFS
jgi:hypothetical protein